MDWLTDYEFLVRHTHTQTNTEKLSLLLWFDDDDKGNKAHHFFFSLFSCCCCSVLLPVFLFILFLQVLPPPPPLLPQLWSQLKTIQCNINSLQNDVFVFVLFQARFSFCWWLSIRIMAAYTIQYFHMNWISTVKIIMMMMVGSGGGGWTWVIILFERKFHAGNQKKWALFVRVCVCAHICMYNVNSNENKKISIQSFKAYL